MAINPVQPNIENKASLNYRDQRGAIKTSDNIRPLKPQGHLVHDTLMSIPKFWYYDFKYDMRALKEGFKGNTNDHQQGRLNDVGLKLGGIGIAIYLASRTTDPKLRLMEYIGLGSFLAAMALYPKIAINAPSRVVHGFDIGKEYIDDQGRKKSVFQDSNYIPFDMYQGDFPGEDLDIIGDRMGIPRDIKNRHDLIKEQMRKIATQNNTLWMLTAGFATPVMAALTCVGLEKLIVPAIEATRNYNANSKIKSSLKHSQNMSLNISDINSNFISNRVNDILSKYKEKELPKDKFNEILELLSDKNDSKINEGIKEDLEKLLKSEVKYKVESDSVISAIKENITSVKKTELEKIFLISSEDLERIIRNISSDEKGLTEEQLKTLKTELKKHFDSKGASNKLYYKNVETDIINKITESIKSKPLNYISESQIKKAVDFAKIIGDFKIKEKQVAKAISIKFEESPLTMLAQSYQKLENTLFDVLDIKYKEIKIMKESPKYAREILETKLEALTKDEAKYKKAIKKLSKNLEEMDVLLNGKNKTNVLSLINATENVYNKTAERLHKLDKDLFSKTINQLVKEEITDEGLENQIKEVDDVYAYLDGTLKAKEGLWPNSLKYAKENSKGVGSSKMNAISRIADRYQGAKNSFNRMILTMDVYKRSLPEGKYENEVAKKAKDIIISANSSDFTQKFKLNNNPELYRDIMFNLFDENKLEKETKDAFVNEKILERFKLYIKRVCDVMGNNGIDFTKPHHVTGRVNVNQTYAQTGLTRRSKFDLVAQDPATMIQKAASNRYGSMLWLRRASLIGASVLGTALLAQFTFGKIKNPQNIKKQVSDDTNN